MQKLKVYTELNSFLVQRYLHNEKTFVDRYVSLQIIRLLINEEELTEDVKYTILFLHVFQ